MKKISTLLLVTYISLFCLGIIDTGRGPSFPYILSEFQMGAKWGSFFFAVTSFAGLLINLSTFIWLPRLGLIKTLRLSLIMISLSSFIVGVSGHLISFDGSLALSALFLGALLLGLGAAGLSISMNLIVPKIVAPAQVRKSLSGLHFFYGLSSLLAPLIMLIMEKGAGGWKNYFILFSIPPLLLYFVGNSNNDSLSDYKKNKIEAPSLSFFKRSIFGFVLACYVASEVLIATRLPLLLQEVHHFSSRDAKFSLTLFFLGLLTGRLLFALISTKINSFKLLFFSLVSTLLIYIPSFHNHPFIFSFSGLSMSFFYPCYISWLNEIFASKSEYMVSITLICVGILLVSMHWSFGIISSIVGLEHAFYLAPALIILALLFLMISKKLSTQVLSL